MLAKIRHIKIEEYCDATRDDCDSEDVFGSSDDVIEDIIKSITTYIDCFSDSTPALEQIQERSVLDAKSPTATEESMNLRGNLDPARSFRIH